MLRGGLLAKRKEGNQVYYRVADRAMVDICRGVCNQVAARVDEKKPMRHKLLRLMPAPKPVAATANESGAVRQSIVTGKRKLA